MELFQLVAGINAVKKVMRDDYEYQPLPPIGSAYTALMYKANRTHVGFEGSRAANHATDSSENEERVA